MTIEATETSGGAAPAEASTETLTTEPGAPAVEKPKPEEQKVAARFAALSKRDRALHEREQALKAKETELAELEKRHSGIKERAQKEPLKVLADELGITYEQLTRHVLNDGKVTPDDKIEALEKKLTEAEQREQDRQKAAEERELAANKAYVERQVNWFKDSIKRTIDAAPAEYELLIANDGYDDVMSVVEEYFDKTGQILEPADAAKQVEEFYEQSAEKLLKLKKIASKLGKAEAETNGDASKDNIFPARKPRPGPKTLTSNHTSSDPLSKKPVTREERRAAAMAKLQFMQAK